MTIQMQLVFLIYNFDMFACGCEILSDRKACDNRVTQGFVDSLQIAAFFVYKEHLTSNIAFQIDNNTWFCFVKYIFHIFDVSYL